MYREHEQPRQEVWTHAGSRLLLASSGYGAIHVEGEREPLARSRTAPLLARSWSFGQFWGVWVIPVFEFQRHHSLTDSRLGPIDVYLNVAAQRETRTRRPVLQWLADLRAAVIVLATVGTIVTGLLAGRKGTK